MGIKYGIISNMGSTVYDHWWRFLLPIIDFFESSGVNGIILNGNSSQYVSRNSYIASTLGESELPVYAVPGEIETLTSWSSIGEFEWRFGDRFTDAESLRAACRKSIMRNLAELGPDNDYVNSVLGLQHSFPQELLDPEEHKNTGSMLTDDLIKKLVDSAPPLFTGRLYRNPYHRDLAQNIKQAASLYLYPFDGSRLEYPNLRNALALGKVECNGHHLVFLGGCDDWTSPGEFKLSSLEGMSTGIYPKNTERRIYGNTVEGRLREAADILLDEDQTGIKSNDILFINIDDLESLVTIPDATVVFCPVPAYFGDEAVDLGKGNTNLRQLFERLGVKVAVSSSPSNAGHIAHNWQGHHVDEGVFTDELFWNAGSIDEGQMGILEVDGGLVRYLNVTFEYDGKNLQLTKPFDLT